MRSTNRLIASLILSAALLAPMSIIAIPTPQTSVQVRIYDRDHKDYHNWDDRENRAWGIYLTNNHKRQHEFTKANKREQSDYWKWRHNNPDHD
jgi:hypothetical protein